MGADREGRRGQRLNGMTRARLILPCLVALTMALSGCGSTADLVQPAESEDGDRESDTDSLGTVTETPSVPMTLDTDGPSYLRLEARQRLRAAKRSLVRDGTGEFVRVSTIADAEHRTMQNIARMKGAYDLRRLQSRNTLTLYDGTGESVRLRVLTRGRRIFVGSAESPCWLVMTPRDIERGTGVHVPNGWVGFPSAVQTLLAARPETTYQGTDKIVATVPLAIVAGLGGSKVNAKLLGKGRGVRVPVLIQLRSKRFVGWTLHGVDLLAALEDSPIRIGRRMREALPYLDVSVTLDDPGTRVRVRLPPERLRVRPRDVSPGRCGDTELT